MTEPTDDNQPPAPAADAAGSPVEPISEGPAVRPTIKAGTEEMYVEARGSFAEGDVAGYVPSPESDQLRVQLASFEGPLDLLLHLIEKHALDVFDIPIKVIVAEYMKVLDDMRELNLDIAGEFLLMAAQLAHLKSKLLLPREERPKEAEPELDPRAELVRRLLEYQRFKDAAARLDARPMLGRDVWARALNGAILYDGPVDDAPVEDVRTALNLAAVDVFDLIRLFDQMLKRQQKLVVHEVLVERISVGARINEIVDTLTAQPRGWSFAELCDAFGPRTKRAVIVTFLSILEMTRLKLVRVQQDDEGHIKVHPVIENLNADDAAAAVVDDYEKPPPPPTQETQA